MINDALQPCYLTREEAEELDDLLEHPRAFPTLPVQGIPRRARSAQGLAPTSSKFDELLSDFDEYTR